MVTWSPPKPRESVLRKLGKLWGAIWETIVFPAPEYKPAPLEPNNKPSRNAFAKWVDITPPDADYQHVTCSDGREMWRPLANPGDTQAQEWRHGRPPNIDRGPPPNPKKK